MAQALPRVCGRCGTLLPDPMPFGRPRQFCSATCRSAARRARVRSDHTACEIEFANIQCGRPTTTTISLGERQLGVCETCAELLRSWLVQRGVQPTFAGNKAAAVTPAELTHTAEPTNDTAAPAGTPTSGAVAVTPPRLSSREREVVALFAKGHTERQVARELGVQETTVQQYLARARLKYDVVDRPARTRIDLYRRAVEDGLLPPEETSPPADAATRRDEGPFSDEAIEKAVDGDPHAIDAVLRAIRPLVHRYCTARITPGLISPDDVAQDVCLAVLTALPSYRAQGRSFLGFVYSIAAHKVADAYRSLARNRSEPVSTLPDQVDLGLGPEEVAIGIRNTEQMAALLNLLPDRLREILLLRVVVGLTTEETAEAVGSTPGAVRVAQHRALAKLRRMVIEQANE